MKSKPAENIEALGQIVEALCKQVEGMTAHQKEQLLAELYDYYLEKPPRWLNRARSSCAWRYGVITY
jgi:hypothetical protein